MKKWLLISIIAVLLVLYGLFLLGWYSGVFTPQVPAQTTVPTQTTVPEAPPPQTTAAPTTEATEATEPTVLYVPVMPEDYVLTCTHAFVYDCNAENYLYTLGDQTEPIAPASLTKLLTAYIALQHLQPDTVVTAGEEVTWVDPASSLATVLPGDRLTVEMLVQGMLMQSGNDAAYAIAVAAGRAIEGNAQLSARDALQRFMDALNAQAPALGLENTHFVSPDGLDAEGHLTTCRDLLRLSLLVLEDPIFVKYAAMPRSDVVFESGKELSWMNTNLLLHPEFECYCPLAVGLKTGYTGNAGACLLAVFQEGSRTMIVGIMGSPTYEERCFDALYLFEQYR